jgi:hypothetical protein
MIGSLEKRFIQQEPRGSRKKQDYSLIGFASAAAAVPAR